MKTKLYTAEEIANILGVTVRTLRNWKNRGWLLTVTLPNGQVRVTETELNRLTKGGENA